ncbi:(Fe-S)-binding protein [Armatimonas rosea]|uniref:Glycolate oxidase iron-sulfur subunit n=1 Tax=Armatimonas rosea TaxID=685828 RepID=A0A7W9SWD1_ARMRO|nr:heterodisulfide reductase-related iron-sulfur binding cluster [Armatimonas rosea]MBB6053618.1 glycolate oxidase iron-sulfur subunit [Armatimonas rosea]
MKEADVEKGLLSCVHCGFCLDACPTYRETGDEADSPRGRLVLMRNVLEGKLPMVGEEATQPGGVGYHLDRCLGCRGCETACPSAVPYGHLLEHFRDLQEHTVSRSTGERVLREGLLMLLTDPKKMKLALKAGRLTGGKIPAFASKFVGLPADTQLPLPDDLEKASAALPALIRAKGEKRGKVALLTGCVMSVLYSPVHRATANLLAANGLDVHVPQNQSCCGALHGHQGKLEGAKELAKKMVAAFENTDYDAIILNSAGCGSFLKDYGHLLKDDSQWADRAAAFAAKIKDVTEYLVEIGPREMTRWITLKITYHDACHLKHGQKIGEAPRTLLKSIPGIEYVECRDADQCCGSAGVYNYLQPALAAEFQKKKVENLLATGAELILTGNPGCLAWIEQGLPDGAQAPKIQHPVELLARAYGD